MATKNLAIMFTDIKGFTARTSSASREGVARLLDEHDRLLLPVFRHFGGNVIKTIGDAFLVTFESPTDSVLCGLTIQEVLRQHNAQTPEKERIQVRVAVNVGEVQLKDNDVLGEPVNIAARLEGITEAGEVYFTESVYLSMKRQEVPTSEIGERVFKGIPYPVRVYRVLWDPNSAQARELSKQVELTQKGPILHVRRPSDESQRRRLIKIAAAGILAALILVPPGYLMLKTYNVKREVRSKAVSQFEKFASGDMPGRAVMKAVRKILDEHPNDPEIPFQAGEILSQRFVPEAVFWLYEESIKRGGHKNDPKIFNAAVRMFGSIPPEGNEAQAAHQILKTYFPDKRLKWAKSALTNENALTILNARHILQE